MKNIQIYFIDVYVGSKKLITSKVIVSDKLTVTFCLTVFD